MQKFIFSVLVGLLVGVILGAIFMFIWIRLPDVFQKAFFNKISVPVDMVENIKEKFKPATNQYIIPTIDNTIPQEGKVAYADLGAMKITLFENGEVIGEYPIASIGREGTAWQTPLGQFDMSYKKENHFSSIGHVYMPWSMHFFGNYFIHGWPYYPDGTPVAEGYSGGCIRMETDQAQYVYDFVDRDTKLVVTTSSNPMEKQTELEYAVKDIAPQLESNFLIADLETGEVLDAKGQNTQIEIGSISKIMTALISLEVLNQYNETVFEQDIVTIADVLYALLLLDNDRAGEILSEHKNANQYLIDMNTRASSLGMNQTKYTDVNGLDTTTVSTLEDQFRLMQYLKWYKPFLIKVFSLTEYKKDSIEWKSIHPHKDVDWYQAGFSNEENTEMITLVTYNPAVDKTDTTQEKTFIIIVQNSADAGVDTFKLYTWITQNVSFAEVQ